LYVDEMYEQLENILRVEAT
jgi:hypothetical protein